MVINMCLGNNTLPQGYTTDTIKKLYKFYVRKSIESFNNNETSYDIIRHY